MSDETKYGSLKIIGSGAWIFNQIFLEGQTVSQITKIINEELSKETGEKYKRAKYDYYENKERGKSQKTEKEVFLNKSPISFC